MCYNDTWLRPATRPALCAPFHVILENSKTVIALTRIAARFHGLPILGRLAEIDPFAAHYQVKTHFIMQTEEFGP
jgi:hypothetical protein